MAIANGSQGDSLPPALCIRDFGGDWPYWEGRLDAITVTGVSRK